MPKILLILVILAVVGVALITLGVVKLPSSINNSSDIPEVELKTEYKNPFDENAQYTNPFSEYKNPFDSLE